MTVVICRTLNTDTFIYAFRSNTCPIISTIFILKAFSIRFLISTLSKFTITTSQKFTSINAFSLKTILPIIRAFFCCRTLLLSTIVIFTFLLFITDEWSLMARHIKVINNASIFTSLALSREIYSSSIFKNSAISWIWLSDVLNLRTCFFIRARLSTILNIWF